MALLDKFSDLGESISSRGKNVVQKAKDATEVAGLNTQIEALDETLRALYEQLGRACFGAKGAFTQEMTDLTGRIADTLAGQDALREQIKIVRRVVCCPGCGKELAFGTAFCPDCGMKAPEPPVRLCAGCGHELSDEAAFCPRCGTAAN